MPRDGFVRKSFVRAILSEVCHHNRINWALFALERWAQKKQATRRAMQFYTTKKKTWLKFMTLVYYRH